MMSVRFLFIYLAIAIQPTTGDEKEIQPNSNAIKPIRLTTDGAYKHRPAWLADGKSLIFARHEAGGNSIFLRQFSPGTSAEPKRLTQRKEPEYNAAISPDGSQMLFTPITLSGTQGNLDIAVMPLDGSADPKTVAGDTGKLSHQDWPAWLPDGRRFVFNSTHEGNQELYLGTIDGSKPLERLTQSPGQDVHPAVSTDGKFLLFATDRWGGLELARLELDTKSVSRLTQSPGLDDYPAIAPDGKSFTFVSNRSGNMEIWLGDFSGHVRQITHDDAPDLFPVFTPDGKNLTYISGHTGNTDIYNLPLPSDWQKTGTSPIHPTIKPEKSK
jgi:TolB protein